jgi:Rha family phage regulatory protein
MESSRHKKTPTLAGDGASGVKTLDGVHEMNSSTVVDIRKFVEARNGLPFTTTQSVAEAFGKQHQHVTQKIESLECSEQFLTSNFSLVGFEHRGNSYKSYEMTKDGFMFLVMGFTGQKAAAIKEAYICAFNWMAEQLGLSSKMLVAKAVHEALGADGARIISNVIRCRVARLDVEHQRSASMKMSSALHARFGVPRTELIPADQMDSACNFIAAYAIEGEYLPKQEEGGLHFSRYEVSAVYIMMSRISSMQKHRECLFAAGRALGADPLKAVADQIRESYFSFSTLDKRRDEIYGMYRSLGSDGGYAMGSAA